MTESPLTDFILIISSRYDFLNLFSPFSQTGVVVGFGRVVFNDGLRLMSKLVTDD